MSSSDLETLTVGKAAALVGIRKAVLYEAIKEGRLKARRLWSKGDLRIIKDDLRRWVGVEKTNTEASPDEAA